MGQPEFGFFSASRLLVALAATLALAACNHDQSGNAATDAVTGISVPAASLVLVGAPPTEATSGVNYFFQPYAMNASSAATFSAKGMPAWMTFDASSGVLSGTPGASDVGNSADITVTAITANASGSIGPFRVLVKSAGWAPPSTPNAPPIISGSPPAAVVAGQTYNFAPTTFDAEGAALSFSIVNRPSWATFDTTTGQLSGTPTAASTGMQSGILIRASDGFVTVALPEFSISVTQASAPTGTTTATNTPPTISGSASGTATADINYSFTPAASDADNDMLSFSIQNKPQWAQFNASTGQLSGTAAAGSYANIVISVSDGKASTALAPFSISVSSGSSGSNGGSGSAMVSWSPPLSNTDGSMLTDLTGFNIYYGKDPNNLTLAVQLDCSWCLWHNLTDLSPGTWYFAVKSYNRLGVESDFSVIANKTIS